jgi:hypothetical protein
LDAIVSARHHENAEVEIAAIIQIVERAAWDAYVEGKHDKKGQHRLAGADMTIDELLVKIPLFRWPITRGNGCYNIHCQCQHVLEADHPKKQHSMIYEQRMMDGECAMVMGTASLLNAHVFSSKSAGFYNVYEKHGPGRYDTWQAFTHTFYSEDAKRWHETTGDFWGGIMQRYFEQGSWPKIREIFQTGAAHRFMVIPEDDLKNWQGPAAGRHVPRDDPRHDWGSLIYQAYNEGTAHPIEAYHACYPANLRNEIRKEEVLI